MLEASEKKRKDGGQDLRTRSLVEGRNGDPFNPQVYRAALKMLSGVVGKQAGMWDVDESKKGIPARYRDGIGVQTIRKALQEHYGGEVFVPATAAYREYLKHPEKFAEFDEKKKANLFLAIGRGGEAVMYVRPCADPWLAAEWRKVYVKPWRKSADVLDNRLVRDCRENGQVVEYFDEAELLAEGKGRLVNLPLSPLPKK